MSSNAAQATGTTSRRILMNNQPDQTTTAARSPRSRSSLRNLLVPAVALLAIASLGLTSGCSSASGTSNAATSTTAASAPTQTITVLTTSTEKVLHTAGASGEHIYGWNRLVGDGTNGTDTVNVEMLATVNYTNGSGGLDGVVTFTYPDGSTLAFMMVGGSTAVAANGTGAVFHSELEMIGGTGKYVTATGTGTFDGSRKSNLVGEGDEMTFALRIS
jgi:hypothetical protein